MKGGHRPKKYEKRMNAEIWSLGGFLKSPNFGDRGNRVLSTSHLARSGSSEAVMKTEVLSTISNHHPALRREQVLGDDQIGFRPTISMLTCPSKVVPGPKPSSN